MPLYLLLSYLDATPHVLPVQYGNTGASVTGRFRSGSSDPYQSSSSHPTLHYGLTEIPSLAVQDFIQDLSLSFWLRATHSGSKEPRVQKTHGAPKKTGADSPTASRRRGQ